MYLVEGLPSCDVSKYYWQRINPLLHEDKLEDNLYVIDKLQEVNRHLTVLDEITYFADNVSSELIATILFKAATIPSNETKHLDSYGIGKLFETLHTRNNLEFQQLRQLEWIYLTFLIDSDSDWKPVTLFKELTDNPEFFVEVASFIYMPDEGKENEQYSEEELTHRYQKANSARSLLESWRDIPGVKEDGSINKEKLMYWIYEARVKAKEYNRTYGVNSEIGKLLAHYPRNDVSWPPEEICEIIDTIDNEDMISHFETEIFNSRGLTVKTAYEGGFQERALSAYFGKIGKQLITKWPITARALLNLSKGYANDAKREDDSAHLDELR